MSGPSVALPTLIGFEKPNPTSWVTLGFIEGVLQNRSHRYTRFSHAAYTTIWSQLQPFQKEFLLSG